MVEIEDFGDSIIVHNLPENRVYPYDDLLPFCENVEHEGGATYRLDGVYADTKKELLSFLRSL